MSERYVAIQRIAIMSGNVYCLLNFVWECFHRTFDFFQKANDGKHNLARPMSNHLKFYVKSKFDLTSVSLKRIHGERKIHTTSSQTNAGRESNVCFFSY